MRKIIETTPSIIEKVAEKLGVKKEKVKAVYNSHISYLNELSLDDSTLSVRIPNLGTLYMQTQGLKALESRMKKLKERGKTKLLSKLEITYKPQFNKLKKLEEYKEVTKEKNRIKHFKKNMIDMKYHNGGESIENIEVIQNKIAEENEKNK